MAEIVIIMTGKITLNIFDIAGKRVDTMKIDEKVLAQRINQDLLHKVIVMSLANKRAGTASTKTRGECRGGGRKPWRQKGTGRARAGTIRSPLWRGGGVIFGPHPRDFSSSLPKKMKNKALIQAIVLKINEKNLIILDDLKIEAPKTKEAAHLLKKLKVTDGTTLLVTKSLDETLKKAARNLPNLELANVKDLNAYNILKNTKVILTKEAFLKVKKMAKL